MWELPPFYPSWVWIEKQASFLLPWMLILPAVPPRYLPLVISSPPVPWRPRPLPSLPKLCPASFPASRPTFFAGRLQFPPPPACSPRQVRQGRPAMERLGSSIDGPARGPEAAVPEVRLASAAAAAGGPPKSHCQPSWSATADSMAVQFPETFRTFVAEKTPSAASAPASAMPPFLMNSHAAAGSTASRHLCCY